jgi:hypothetical protein
MATRTDRSSENRPGRGTSEVQQFLDRFAQALTAGDGHTIATLWEAPALVIGDGGVQAVNSTQEVEQFFSGAKEQYNKLGITDTRAEILRVDPMTDRILVVEVRWPYLDQEGNEAGEESSTYTLRRDDQGHLKIRAVVMHGARTAEGGRSTEPVRSK